MRRPNCPGKRDLTIPAHASHRPGLNLAIRHITRLEQAGAITSAGSRGDCDNALADTIIGLYKAELTRHRGPWHSMALVEAATAWWVGWFNNRGLYGPLGDIPPFAAIRAGHRAMQHVPRVPAQTGRPGGQSRARPIPCRPAACRHCCCVAREIVPRQIDLIWAPLLTSAERTNGAHNGGYLEPSLSMPRLTRTSAALTCS